MSNPLVITPAASFAADLLEAVKQILRIEYDDDDTLLTSFIDWATEKCEFDCNRRFGTQTLRWTSRPVCTLHPFPRNFGPLVSITSAVDGDAAAVTYTLDDVPEIHVLELGSLPEKLVVTYVAGYGDELDDMPLCVVDAIRTAAVWKWRNREGQAFPKEISRILDPIRLR